MDDDTLTLVGPAEGRCRRSRQSGTYRSAARAMALRPSLLTRAPLKMRTTTPRTRRTIRMQLHASTVLLRDAAIFHENELQLRTRRVFRQPSRVPQPNQLVATGAFALPSDATENC